MLPRRLTMSQNSGNPKKSTGWMVQFKIGEHFLIANAPIPSASGFGGGFGCLNTFSQGIWRLRNGPFERPKNYGMDFFQCMNTTVRFRKFSVRFWKMFCFINLSVPVMKQDKNTMMVNTTGVVHRGDDSFVVCSSFKLVFLYVGAEFCGNFHRFNR